MSNLKKRMIKEQEERLPEYRERIERAEKVIARRSGSWSYAHYLGGVANIAESQADYWSDYADGKDRWSRDKNPIMEPLWEMGRLPRRHFPDWADHTTIKKINGITRYIAHPYDLNPKDLEDLLILSNAGFTVHVDGHTRYGWGTMKVTIWEPEKD